MTLREERPMLMRMVISSSSKLFTYLGASDIYIKSLYEEDRRTIQETCCSFMAFDPDCFLDREEFKKNMDRYIKSIKESAKAQGATEILMPGEPEYRTELRLLKEGIPLAPNTVKELTALGESLGLPYRL